MLPALADALANGVSPHPGSRAPAGVSAAGKLCNKVRARALKNNHVLRAA
jgi:hypothetical protein